ncbi:MAG: RagB/SusD family nutrient uptake outer membrane protein [Bacteroidales bacterium]|nr:RagB/SusD family nutrient uptake outer membrane protein [Bacteroidales bacterium]
MKQITKLIVVCLSFLALASCHKDLDIVQDDRMTASNMWKTSAHVEGSTVDIYASLRANFAQMDISVLHWGELRVGEFMWSKSRVVNAYTSKDVIQNTMTSATANCSWSALYSAIDQANAVLKYAPDENIPMTVAKRSWAIGQAAFARAYCYFWAVRLWGDVPLNLNPIESFDQPEMYPSRTPKAQVYAQIEEDLKLAVANVDNLGSNKYLATKDAVYMLAAECALWMYTNQKAGDSYLSRAEEALNAIGVKPGDPRFLPRYEDIFDGRGRENKNSAEVVFALFNSAKESKLGGFNIYFTHSTPFVKAAFQNSPVPIGTFQSLDFGDGYLEMLRDSRDHKGDSRVPTILGDGNYGTMGDGNLTWVNKFIGDLSSGTMVRDCDLLYYRYAFAVMMMAELKYYQGKYDESLNYLNMIAKRAYGKDSYYSVATKDEVLEALVREYFLEFPAEGVIWWALIRLDKIWDYNETLRERKNDTNILLWPITKSARNRNSNLEQTEGWY